ncbi:MAG: hypothetical protein PVG53_06350 [Holophagae bacterium]|jgi:hypothetical protein
MTPDGPPRPGGIVDRPSSLKTMERLYLVAFFGQLLLRISRWNVADVDLWGRLSVPAVFFACGRLPVRDYFSFTAYGAPWFDHEWLAGFFFHGALATFGGAGLTLFKWALALGMLWFLWLVNRRRAAPPLVVFLVAMMALPMWGIGFGATARSQNLTYFLFALLLLLLERIRQRPDRTMIALVVPIALVWVNVHAGFVVGFGILVLYVLGSLLNRENARPFAAATGLFAVATLINPYGWSYLKFVLYAITLHRPEIAEWAGTNPLKLSYWTFVALSVLALAALIMAWRERRRDLDWVPVLVILATMVFGWRAVKHQALFGVAAVAFLPSVIQWAWPGLFVGRRFRFELRTSSIEQTTRTWLPAGLTLAALITLAVLLLTQPHPFDPQLPYGNFNPLGNGNLPYPVHAVEFLEKAPFRGNLLAPFDHGQFLLYCLYPKFRVAVDGRMEEVYPAATYREMMRFFDSVPPDWTIAEDWNADVVLWPQHASRLTMADVSPDFVAVQQDGEYIVFVRRRVLAGPFDARPEPPRFSTGPVYLDDFFRPDDDRVRFSSYCAEPTMQRGDVR